MSTAASSAYPIDYSEPRVIWTIVLQLLYSLLAMLPVYYFMRNLISIPKEGQYLLEYLPIAVGVLLFFIQFLMNDYYWNQEKTFIKRDIFECGLKSSILTLSIFYTMFFLIFNYWVPNNGGYQEGMLTDIITRLMTQLGITLGTIFVIYVLMKGAQDNFSAAKKFGSRFRRR